MIVDTPSIIQVALGTDRRIPEQGDAQVNLPNTLLSTLQLMQITRELASSATPVTESVQTSSTRQNNNQAATADTLVTCPPGFYVIDANLAAISNLMSTLAAGDDGVRLLMEYGTTTFTIIDLYVAANAAYYASTSIQVLMPVQFTIVHRVMVTPVGQTIKSRAGVNIRRIL
jgi:hypothetical protein